MTEQCFRPLPRVLATALLAAALLAFTRPASGQERLRLWPDTPAPRLAEVVEQQPDGSRTITDVVDPSLTVYLPDPARANGAAVIIAPGGAMRLLSVPDYRQSAARWLNQRGFAAFVLHYRLVPSTHRMAAALPEMARFPMANANPFPDDPVMKLTIDNAIADGQRAVQIVRARAGRWHIDPARVGMLGVSAGGAVMLGSVVRPSEGGAPDFLISAYGPSLINVEVPQNRPPLFMAVRQHHPNVARALVALYEVWTAAGAPAELHIYQQQEERPFLPSTGRWLDDAYLWMQERGIVPATNNDAVSGGRNGKGN